MREAFIVSVAPLSNFFRHRDSVAVQITAISFAEQQADGSLCSLARADKDASDLCRIDQPAGPNELARPDPVT